MATAPREPDHNNRSDTEAAVDSDPRSWLKLLDVDDLMPIGEFSAQSGLSQKRLRSYANAGLLVPAAVDSASGYRYYAPGQVHDAIVIEALRRAGISLPEIAEMLRDPSDERLEHWMARLEDDALNRRAALSRAREFLAQRLSWSRAATTNGRKPMSAWNGVALSLTGRVRENNEDVAVCNDRLLAVADGLGGLPGGEVAAAIAMSVVDAAFTGKSVDELEAATRAANRAVVDRGRATSRLEGMATTLCAVGSLDGESIAIVNVGDSRAYVLRDGSLTQLTDDHTVTAELVRHGAITESEVAQHPLRNVVTRVVGAGDAVEVDAAVHRLQVGDRILVCTDGLYRDVDDENIRSAMRDASDASSASEALVERALAAGGNDNITVVVADVL